MLGSLTSKRARLVTLCVVAFVAFLALRVYLVCEEVHRLRIRLNGMCQLVARLQQTTSSYVPYGRAAEQPPPRRDGDESDDSGSERERRDEEGDDERDDERDEEGDDERDDDERDDDERDSESGSGESESEIETYDNDDAIRRSTAQYASDLSDEEVPP